jgi:hypothetical protein
MQRDKEVFAFGNCCCMNVRTNSGSFPSSMAALWAGQQRRRMSSLPKLPCQALRIGEVMDGQQLRPERIPPCQAVQIRAAEPPTRLAAAVSLQRTEVTCKLSAPQLQGACSYERCAEPGRAGRVHAVEHVHAEADANDLYAPTTKASGHERNGAATAEQGRNLRTMSRG